ncbi:ABC transporter ATP-binding protein [Planosporangium sp. 12N6]|uniref:ABC transporter ATP-binding protein n=1 Tax=Planosporangium spinosum TaxID=3402278 RepID=UPI003CEF2012
MPILELNDVSVRYGGVHALNGVTFSVEEGSITGLIGPNGAGKTTLIDTLTGMTRYTGHIRYGGHVIDTWPAYKRSRNGLVRTFQSVELFHDLTIRENLLVYAAPHGLRQLGQRLRRSSEMETKILEALSLFGVEWAIDRFPDDLPHGTQRVISIARALVSDPRVLLLDEPAAGLEVGETRQLAEHLRGLVDQRGVTILLIDHDMDLVLGHCDEVHVLSFGQWLAGGPPSVIREHPEVLRAYLGTPAEQLVGEGGASS